MAKAKDTALAVAEEQTTALSFVAEEVDESQYIANFDFKADEQAMSFLKQAQAMSPELNAATPEYIDGLKQGGFFVYAADRNPNWCNSYRTEQQFLKKLTQRITTCSSFYRLYTQRTESREWNR